jgi:hypothetical protein
MSRRSAEVYVPRVEQPGANPEVRSGNRRILFALGVTATDMRNKGYFNAFSDPRRYGEGNVLVMNSIVSADKRNRGRFRKMQEFITGADAQTGIDIGVHSLGSAEVAEAISRIQQETPGFWENEPNKDRFNFVLIDPSGFNISDEQKKEYKRNTTRLMREHANLPLFSQKRTLVRGIDSLVAFPPQGFSPDAMQDLISAVAVITPSLSTPEERDGLPTIPFKHVRDNEAYKIEFLSDAQRAELEKVDKSLRWALSRKDAHGNLLSPNILRRIIQERGEILKNAIDRIYESRLEEPLDAKEGGLLKLLFSLGRRDARQMLRSALGSGPMEKFKELYDMGYKNITLVSTEHGIAVPLGNLLQMFDSEEQAAHVQIAEFATHPTPGLQPEATADMIWNLGQQRTDDILTA